MLWGCSSAAGLVLLAIVEDKLNAAEYRESWRKKNLPQSATVTHLSFSTITLEFVQIEFHFEVFIFLSVHVFK